MVLLISSLIRAIVTSLLFVSADLTTFSVMVISNIVVVVVVVVDAMVIVVIVVIWHSNTSYIIGKKQEQTKARLGTDDICMRVWGTSEQVQVVDESQGWRRMQPLFLFFFFTIISSRRIGNGHQRLGESVIRHGKAGGVDK